MVFTFFDYATARVHIQRRDSTSFLAGEDCSSLSILLDLSGKMHLMSALEHRSHAREKIRSGVMYATDRTPWSLHARVVLLRAVM